MSDYQRGHERGVSTGSTSPGLFNMFCSSEYRRGLEAGAREYERREYEERSARERRESEEGDSREVHVHISRDNSEDDPDEGYMFYPEKTTSSERYKIYEQLTEESSEAYLSIDTFNELKNLQLRYCLSEEQYQKLQEEIAYVWIGLSRRERFESRIRSSLGVPMEKADAIIKELTQKFGCYWNKKQ